MFDSSAHTGVDWDPTNPFVVKTDERASVKLGFDLHPSGSRPAQSNFTSQQNEILDAYANDWEHIPSQSPQSHQALLARTQAFIEQYTPSLMPKPGLSKKMAKLVLRPAKKKLKARKARPAAPRRDAQVARLPAPVSEIVAVRNARPVVTGNKWTGDGSIRVQRREYITDVSAFDEFTVYKVELNPGLPTFHWLSRIANEYDLYRINALRIIYETDVATTVAGTVMLGVDYDPTDNPPSTKQDLRDFNNTVKGPLWGNLVFHLDPRIVHASNPAKFIRYGNAPSGTDRKNYDAGNFYFGISGASGSSIVGELSVEYDITLMSPHFDQREIALGSSNQYNCLTAVTASQPFGTVGSQVVYGEGGQTLLFPSTSQMQIQEAGYYYFVVTFRGTGLATGALFPFYASSTNGVVTQDTQGGTYGATLVNAAATEYELRFYAFQKKTRYGALTNLGIEFGNAVTAASFTSTTIRVFRGAV